MRKEVVYVASKTATEFHNCDKFTRLLMGPVGGGKSVACVIELIKRSFEQKPFNGIRKTRWAIIRNTYAELRDTTTKTFFQWVDPSLGRYMVQSTTFTMRLTLPDGTKVEAEYIFRALDKPQDIKKLLSLELTGAFINECREIPKQILSMAQTRVGRYPAKFEGGVTWFGVILDTNPPDMDNWLYKTFAEDLPDNHAFFQQPSGMSDEAENVENLPTNYYPNMMQGKQEEWINVYVHGRFGFVHDGKVVYPEYKDSTHHRESYKVQKSTIYIGIDFGLTPAAVFGQKTSSGRMVIFDELVTFDMGAVTFGTLLKEKIANKYPNHDFEIYGDPAGDQRAQTDEITPFMILQNQGIMAIPTYTNDPVIRREAVADYLMRLDFTGEPAFMLTTECKMLRKAFNGGYCYKRMQVSGEERFTDKPDKGKYSHVSDALQYLFLGAVGGDAVVGGFDHKQIEYSNKGIV